MIEKNNLLILERSAGNLKLNKENSGEYVLKGIFGEIDVKNKNNRIYTESEYVPQIKALQDKIKSSREQMLKSIEMASQAFFKVRTIILDKDSLNQEQKQQYIKKLYDKIIEKFMTAEEKKLFEQIIAGNGIIIMNGNGIRLGGGMGGMRLGGGMGGMGGGGMGGMGGGGMGGMLGF